VTELVLIHPADAIPFAEKLMFALLSIEQKYPDCVNLKPGVLNGRRELRLTGTGRDERELDKKRVNQKQDQIRQGKVRNLRGTYPT
jgi:hypothetical protein